MYSISSVPVDRGLGFDFGSLIEGVAKIGTDVYKQTMALKVAKAQATNPYGAPMMNPAQIPVGALPSASFYTPMQNVPQPFVTQQSGMSTGTMLAIGGLVLGGLAFVILNKKASA